MRPVQFGSEKISNLKFESFHWKLQFEKKVTGYFFWSGTGSIFGAFEWGYLIASIEYNSEADGSGWIWYHRWFLRKSAATFEVGCNCENCCLMDSIIWIPYYGSHMNNEVGYPSTDNRKYSTAEFRKYWNETVLIGLPNRTPSLIQLEDAQIKFWKDFLFPGNVHRKEPNCW